MTGGTGGFGAHTLELLAARSDTKIFLGARGEDRSVPQGVTVLPLDLSSLESVRQFAAAVSVIAQSSPIGLMVLNAGIHGSRADERSAEGFGLAFAVNHLGHYLLLRLLLPLVADGGRIIITTSNMHDPPLKSIGPQFLDLEEWAHPSKNGSGDGIRSYTATKLCNLMTALYLARLCEVRERNIQVIAFNPGLTAGSSGRDASGIQKTAVTLLSRTVFPLIGLFRPEFRMNSAAHSGGKLAEIALGELSPPDGQVYVSLVGGKPTAPPPSALAQDQQAQQTLWRESSSMVGLDDQLPIPAERRTEPGLFQPLIGEE